jgi:hypothetical protein
LGLFFEEKLYKRIMEMNKPDNQTEPAQPQTVVDRDAPINPFRNPPPEPDPQQRAQEEIETEQQRKEALTERD